MLQIKKSNPSNTLPSKLSMRTGLCNFQHAFQPSSILVCLFLVFLCAFVCVEAFKKMSDNEENNLHNMQSYSKENSIVPYAQPIVCFVTFLRTNIRLLLFYRYLYRRICITCSIFPSCFTRENEKKNKQTTLSYMLY